MVKNAGRETWDALKSSVDDNRIVMKGDIDIYCTNKLGLLYSTVLA